MPINIANLTEQMAAELGFPAATAEVIARVGRRRGMLSSGGRGRHVARATGTDAAHLLIAMMASPTPARGWEYMRDFGDLIAFSSNINLGEVYRDEIAELFPEGQRLRDGIAGLIEAFGDRKFVERLYKKFCLRKASMFSHLEGENMPYVEVSVFDTSLSATIDIGDARVLYKYSSLQFLTPEAEKSFVHEDEYAFVKRKAVEEFKSVSDKYFRAIQSVRTVNQDVLCKIAGMLNGRTFQDIVDAWSKRPTNQLRVENMSPTASIPIKSDEKEREMQRLIAIENKTPEEARELVELLFRPEIDEEGLADGE